MSQQNSQSRPPLVSAQAKGNTAIAFVLLWTLVSWHLALWIVSDGLGIGQVAVTWRAITRLSPLELDGVDVGPLWVVLTVWGLLVLAPIVALAWWAVWRGRRLHGKNSGMAGAKTLTASMKPRGDGASIESFMLLGKTELRTRSEDTGCAVAPPRSGKTLFIATNLILDASGPVVTTSTKVDVLRLTAQARSKMGRLWLFDPEGITGWTDRLRWDIVAGCESVKVAGERARAMVSARPMDSGKNAGFFQEAAVTVLRSYLHAAALSGATMREVMAWARNFENERPYEILATHPEAAPGWDRDLEKFCRAEARETVASTDMSLSLVLAPLSDPEVLATVCPSEDGTFDPEAFCTSTDTLYLLSEGEDTGAAPLLTALLAAVVRAGRQASQRTAQGRLVPHMTFALDEVANIAPISNLPQLMSDGGGRGQCVWVLTQDYAQLERRYQREGAQEIWGSAAVKLVLGGSANDKFLDSVSSLAGERRVTRTGTHYGKDSSTPDLNYSTERERVLPVSELRQISDGQAVLLYRNQAPALVTLLPWWERKDAKQIEQARAWSLAKEGRS